MAPFVQGKWTAVLLIGLATAAHQGFSANLFTLTSDLFPRRAVGSVVGIGGFAGAIGGFFLLLASGYIKQVTGSYAILFAIASTVYLLALLAIHFLSPELKPAAVEEAQQQRVTAPATL
jgi:ACS family hexuronate transporter-like MFS transporter